MSKISIVCFFMAATFGITACGDGSSASGPDSNNISCKAVIHGDTVVTTQKSSSGKTIRTIAIVGDSITEKTQDFFYDSEVRNIFMENCTESALQKCGKDNITVYSAPRSKGKETVQSIKAAEDEACDGFLSAKMAQN